MADYERAQVSTLLNRLSEKPRYITIVTGPRQTGKTTLVQQVLGRLDRPYHYMPVEEPDSATLTQFTDSHGLAPELVNQPNFPITGPRDALWLVRNWEVARLKSRQSDRGFVLVIDEIQKIPNWSETVKGLWDADRWNDRHLHVILLGSAPLQLQQGMGESLAGRFETIHLTHWSFAEMSAAFGFDLDRYIYFGGYPGSARFVTEQDRWRTYIIEALIEPNIERDILAMRQVNKPALLKQLFQLGAEYSGQILAYNKMLGQLQDAGNTRTLAHYLDLLLKVGLIAGIKNYTVKAHRREASSPKLNVLNTALMAALSEYTFEEAKADRSYWGRLVESAVGAHLLNTGKLEHRLYYWRENGSEVDFVLARGRRLVAFEVKSDTRRAKTSGVERFSKRFKVLRTVIVGGDGGHSLSDVLSAPAQTWFDSP